MWILYHSCNIICLFVSSGGLRWARDNVKNFHVNMCSYYSKGAADYVGVWDFDEFFQPMGKNKNLLDVLRAMGDPKGIIQNFHPKDADPDQIQLTWKGGRGVADGDGHPFCYLLLDSAVTQVSVPSKTAAQNVRPHLSTFSGNFFPIPSLAP